MGFTQRSAQAPQLVEIRHQLTHAQIDSIHRHRPAWEREQCEHFGVARKDRKRHVTAPRLQRISPPRAGRKQTLVCHRHVSRRAVIEPHPTIRVRPQPPRQPEHGLRRSLSGRDLRQRIVRLDDVVPPNQSSSLKPVPPVVRSSSNCTTVRLPQLSKRTKFPPEVHRGSCPKTTEDFPRGGFTGGCARMAARHPPQSVQRDCARRRHAAKPERTPVPLATVLTVAILGSNEATGATSGQLTPVICVAAYRAESLRRRCQHAREGVQ